MKRFTLAVFFMCVVYGLFAVNSFYADGVSGKSSVFSIETLQRIDYEQMSQYPFSVVFANSDTKIDNGRAVGFLETEAPSITLTVNNPEYGTITKNLTSDGNYELFATPKEDCKFVGWSDVVEVINPRVVNVVKDTVICANFVKIEPFLSASIEEEDNEYAMVCLEAGSVSWGTDVYLYAWRGSGTDEIYGKWPGTKCPNINGRYVKLIPKHKSYNLIWNCGSNSCQTVDICCVDEDACFRLRSAYNGKYDVERNYGSSCRLSDFSIVSLDAASIDYRDVYLYARSEALGVEVLGSWPGVKCIGDEKKFVDVIPNDMHLDLLWSCSGCPGVEIKDVNETTCFRLNKDGDEKSIEETNCLNLNNKQIRVESNTSWEATCDKSWVHLSSTSGTGYRTIEVSIDGSSSYVSDTASVIISTVDGQKSVEIPVIRRGVEGKYLVQFVNYDGTVLQSEELDYGDTPEYKGQTPVRLADAQYTYTFNGWEPEIAEVTGTQTYTARFTNTINKYTIRFLNYNGDVLQSEKLDYGDTPSYSSNIPTQPSSAQYSYTFVGWNSVIAPVTQDADYTAVYASTVNSYTIRFLNEDGTVLQTESLEYGTVPTYKGDEPTKPATAQYTYSFAGWNNAIAPVEKDADYTATYTSTVNKYEITFVNYDGKELQSMAFDYGDTPVYTGETPAKPADAQYTYTFEGWQPKVAPVTGAQTYTAQYSSTVNSYTVRFLNEDGTVLQTESLEYGTVPTYKGDEPTKPATTQYTYSFAGWNSTLAPVEKDADYTATYTSTVNKYEITFVNYDGKELQSMAFDYGDTPVYTGETPAKPADAQYTYTFEGWQPKVAPVTGAQTYTAQYSSTVNSYTVRFLNEDGTVLQTESLEYGTVPTYKGNEPIKPATAQYTYSFAGWDNALAPVEKDADYTATYTSTVNKYEITFVNYDGKELQSGAVDYGETPSYSGETPTKPSDAQYTYTFDGWQPKLAPVTGEQTYTAQYASTVNSYTVRFLNEDGTELQTESLEYGTVPTYKGDEPTKPATAQYTYSFGGWDNALAPVEKDADYTATYTSTVNKYDITFVNYDGKELQSMAFDYGDTPVYTGETPTKPADAQYTYTFDGWQPKLAPVTGIQTYTAQFTSNLRKYTVNAESSDPDYGMVEVSPAGMVDYGTTVTVEAIAEHGYVFVGWSDGVTDNPRTIFVDRNYNLLAYYVENIFTVDGIRYITNDQVTASVISLNHGEKYMGNVVVPSSVSYKGRTYIVNSIGEHAFANCVGMTSIDMPSNITSIESEAFYGCTGLTSITIPNGISSIKEDTFTGCTGLSSITIPSGIKLIKSYAFANCIGLSSIFCESANPPLVESSSAFKNVDRSIPLYVPIDCIEVYRKANVWNEFTNIHVAINYEVIFLNFDGEELQSVMVEYGTTPIYTGETPTKPADAQYTYTFDGWQPKLAPVTGAQTYTAQYASTVNSYTIRFLNEDGTVLQTESLEYGTVPTYKGDEPTKPATAQYTYSFAGWNNALAPVEKDADYTATYTSTVNKYDITFVNYDGKELQSVAFDYGDTPVYTGETPTKPADAQYTYTFDGWQPKLAPVTGAQTYTAQYASIVNSYTIRFLNEDGTVLQTESLEYGTVPTYKGDEPTKPATAQYTYSFAGWNNALAPVEKDADYTATYTSTVNKYEITFVNYDGKELQSMAFDYGDTPVYTGETPTKPADAQYTYTFDGWQPKLAPVTGAQTYTAKYASTVNSYTIRFLNEDGTVLQTESLEYGTVPTYKGNEPTKPATAQYTYSFAGWNNVLAPVEKDADYTATYTSTVNKYEITFVNYDGKELQSVAFDYGDTPVYIGETPAKPSDAQYTYTFDGWQPKLAPVTGAQTYTAQYASTVNSYTIRFLNEDGTVLQTESLEYGTVPTYKGDEPTKPATAQYTYSFAGWNNALAPVEKDADYTATYTSAVNKYEITFVNYDGKELQSVAFDYGDTPVYTGETPAKPADAQYTYSFDGWQPKLAPVTGAQTYTAHYASTVNSYTIRFLNEDCAVLQTESLEYGTVPTYKGDEPTKPATAQYTYSFGGWDNALAPVEKDADYTATYTSTVNKYDITFVNYDGKELQSMAFDYGDTPVYTGETPTKPADAQYTYTFDGWQPKLAPVTGEQTYTAQYASTVNSYTVRFLNEDGTELQTESLEYGTVPTYKGDEPTKPATAQYTYSFAGWNNALAPVEKDADYTATYTSTVNQYAVNVTSSDLERGSVTVSPEGLVDYGTEVTIEAVASDGFLFKNWSDGTTDNPRTITADKNYNFEAEFCRTEYISISESIFKGEEYDFGGTILTKRGTYTETFVNAEGCDSVVVLRLNVLPLPTYIIRLNVNKEGWGTVTGDSVYEKGTVATLEAQPSSGYKFKCWYKYDKNNNEQEYIYDNPYSCVVDSSFTMMASFERAPRIKVNYESRRAEVNIDDSDIISVVTSAKQYVYVDNVDYHDIMIYDTTGHVWVKQNRTINYEGFLPSGVYIIRVDDVTEKFIVH